MRYPVEDTAKRHDILVKKASEMFRERGFENVSVAEVMKAAGLTHGTFYSHFDSKTDLMRASTERALEKSRAGVEKNFRTKQGRARYIDSYLSARHRNDIAAGCALPALSGELRREPELQEMFAKKLEEIIEATGEPRTEAMLTLATLVGAVSLSRAVGQSPLADEILESVRAQMSSR